MYIFAAILILPRLMGGSEGAAAQGAPAAQTAARR